MSSGTVFKKITKVNIFYFPKSLSSIQLRNYFRYLLVKHFVYFFHIFVHISCSKSKKICSRKPVIYQSKTPRVEYLDGLSKAVKATPP